MAVGGSHGTGWSLTMAAMAVACAPCVLGLIRQPQEAGPVRMALAMAVTMVLLHLVLFILTADVGGHLHRSHHQGGIAETGPKSEYVIGVHHSSVMFLLIGLELMVAGLASFRLRSWWPGSRPTA
jgi:hypothetical protein